MLEPVAEQFRLMTNGIYTGSITLAYPNRTTVLAMGLINNKPMNKEHIRSILRHVKSRGKKEIIFYRVKNGKEIEKRYLI